MPAAVMISRHLAISADMTAANSSGLSPRLNGWWTWLVLARRKTYCSAVECSTRLYAVDLKTEIIYVAPNVFWQASALIDGGEKSKTIEFAKADTKEDYEALAIAYTLYAATHPTISDYVSAHLLALGRIRDFYRVANRCVSVRCRHRGKRAGLQGFASVCEGSAMALGQQSLEREQRQGQLRELRIDAQCFRTSIQKSQNVCFVTKQRNFSRKALAGLICYSLSIR
jgi:hypothetical protein